MNPAGLQDRSSVIFLHTSHEQFDSEVTKTVSFTAESKIIKYLGINLTEEIVHSKLQSIIERILKDFNK